MTPDSAAAPLPGASRSRYALQVVYVCEAAASFSPHEWEEAPSGPAAANWGDELQVMMKEG